MLDIISAASDWGSPSVRQLVNVFEEQSICRLSRFVDITDLHKFLITEESLEDFESLSCMSVAELGFLVQFVLVFLPLDFRKLLDFV